VTFIADQNKGFGQRTAIFLNLIDIKDCDNDTLLIQVKPEGPTCHKGTDTCWATENKSNYGFISALEDTIQVRREMQILKVMWLLYLNWESIKLHRKSVKKLLKW
jgi:hypothetical protein